MKWPSQILLLPAVFASPTQAGEAGGALLKYAVQQFLWQDTTNPKRGWGVFGHVGVSSGTPSILDWCLTAGLAG